MKISIPIEMQRFNRAVEQIDWISQFRFDRCEPESLYEWLDAKDYYALARAFRLIAKDVGYFQKESEWPGVEFSSR